MIRQRHVFLFGAGAILDWGAPKTESLTDLITKSGFYTNELEKGNQDSQIRITSFIKQKLLDAGYREYEVNFETIINVIEELLVYYSEFNSENKTPSLLGTFLKEKSFTKILFNYSIRDDKRKHGYKLQVPKGQNYKFSGSAYNNENPHQFFLQHLITELLTDICNEVIRYSYHSNEDLQIELNSKQSQLFISWMENINKNSVMRMYSLNYDNIFAQLLGAVNVNCFEGFYSNPKAQGYNLMKANLVRILTDYDSCCYYNLHGSAYWKVFTDDSSTPPNPEIVYASYPDLPINDLVPTLQVEKGKPVLVTNIITGYQKAQKRHIPPYSHMHHAYERDCHTCRVLTIVGYSFGDEHVNQAIKSSMKQNLNLQIEIVDPGFLSSYIEEKFFLEFLSLRNISALNPHRIADDIIGYYGDRIMVYNMKFLDFLEYKQNKS